MTEKSYYVRWRGRLEGPFSLEDLKRRRAAGRLSRLHDVSTDQAEWRQAKDMPELVPPVAQTPRQPEAAAPPSDWSLDQGPADEAPEPAPILEGAVTWYYEKEGQVEGPYATSDMLALIDDGVLGPHNRVSSSKNPERWDYIRDAPELAAAVRPEAGQTSGPQTEYNFVEDGPGPGGLLAGIVLMVVGVGLGLAAAWVAFGGGEEGPSWAAAGALGLLGLTALVGGGVSVAAYLRRIRDTKP